MASKWRKWLGLDRSSDAEAGLAASDPTTEIAAPPSSNASPSSNEATSDQSNVDQPNEPESIPNGEDSSAVEDSLDPWELNGVPAADVSKWSSHRFTPGDAALWRSHGCEHAFLADRWRKAGISPADAGFWISGRLSEPHATATWSNAGWSAEEAAPWLVEGISSPKAASRWRVAGLGPTEAHRWTSVGLHDPETALALVDASISPEDVGVFIASGAVVDIAIAWLEASEQVGIELWAQRREWAAASITPEQARKWVDAGASVSDARFLIERRIDFESASAWRLRTPRDVEFVLRWVRGGMTPRDLKEWSKTDWPPEVIDGWQLAGSGADDAAAWTALGVTPAQSKRWVTNGFGIGDVTDWTAHGITNVSVALAWQRCGVSASEVPIWATKGITSPAKCRSWVTNGFGIGDVTDWTAHGITNVSLALAWQRCGVSATDVPVWTTLGITTPADCKKWLDHGMGARLVVDWLAQGVHDVAEAEMWHKVGISATESSGWRETGHDALSAKTWREIGIRQPEEASIWAKAGFLAEDAGEWHRSGFKADDARAWINAGVLTPASARDWIRFGRDQAAARQWLANGISAELGMAWASVGVDGLVAATEWNRTRLSPRAAAEWLQCGFSAKESYSWTAAGIGAVTALKWHDAGWTADAAVPWLRARIELPIDASYLLGRGLRAPDVALVRRLEVSVQTLRRWAADGLNGDDLEALRRVLDSPSATAAWQRVDVPTTDWPRWIPLFPDNPGLASAWRNQGVSPITLKAAVDQGLRPERLTVWMNAGCSGRQMLNAFGRGETDPPRMKPVAPPSHLAAEFRQWIADGGDWIETAGMRCSERDPFLRLLFGRRLGWVGMEETVFDHWPDEDWLEEVLARAEVLIPRRRREPDFPATFHSDELSIVLHLDGEWVRAWSGRQGRGMLTSFRPRDFEVEYRQGDGDARLALGFAIGWFLDCSVSLIGTSSHPHFERTTPLSATGTSRTTDVIYVPRPTFRKDLEEVTAGSKTPPRAHRVAGHVRTLPSGSTPSEEARGRAPSYIRLNMASNETFVQAHTRGGSNSLRELTVHLSRYSSLADFIGLARRRA